MIDNVQPSVYPYPSEPNPRDGSYRIQTAVEDAAQANQAQSLNEDAELLASSMEEEGDVLVDGIIKSYINNRDMHHKLLNEVNDENRQF